LKHSICRLWLAATLLGISQVFSVLPGVAVASEAADPPVVLATTRPLHSIAAYVTDGVSEARLLIDGSLSPHVFQLKPSHVRAVRDADIILWAGEGVERFIPSMLKNFAADTSAIELAALPEVVTYHSRGSGDDHTHNHESIDFHLWAHPANAELLAFALADQLAMLDAANQQTYRANAAAFAAELNDAVKDVEKILAVAQGKNYLIYHDSLQYFEKAFGLGEAIIVTAQPQVQAGAKRIRKLQAEVEVNNVACILAELQFRSPAIDVLASDLQVQTVRIDPLASTLDSGLSLYINWMRETASSIAGCYQ